LKYKEFKKEIKP